MGQISENAGRNLAGEGSTRQTKNSDPAALAFDASPGTGGLVACIPELDGSAGEGRTEREKGSLVGGEIRFDGGNEGKGGQKAEEKVKQKVGRLHVRERGRREKPR